MSEHDQPGDRAERPEQEPAAPRLNPRIWIASLADYNAGRLHGDWVDAAVDDDELVDAAQRILASSHEPNAEEWGIFDYDEFGSFRVNEYDDLTVVAKVARGIKQHGPAFAAWAELHDGDSDMLDQFEDAFLGEYDSREAFVDFILEDFQVDQTLTKALPGWLAYRITIDREGIAHDLRLSGDMYFEEGPDGVVWVFDARS